MALPLYLAMTGAEFYAAAKLPPKAAWMACHFSAYGTGLSNLPDTLPPGAMVILNDRTPIHGHDPDRILQQLGNCVKKHNAACVLLDFQREGCEACASLSRLLAESLNCPVGVSALYGRDLSCPIFLPPAPLDTPLAQYLAPWQGREIWLEAALDCAAITVTPHGAASSPAFPPAQLPHLEEWLHCRYAIEASESQVRFTLCRTADTLPGLLEEAQALGVTQAVGLYQELGNMERHVDRRGSQQP